MVVANDSLLTLLPALALVLALGPTPDALLDPEELPMTARCPEISVNKKKEEHLHCWMARKE